MDLGMEPTTRYCYDHESPRLSDDGRIREVNANKLAAHLLLPEDLVRQANLDEVLRDLVGTASRWQVSRTALEIRLRELDLIREPNKSQLNLT